jgi:hypothetical protein
MNLLRHAHITKMTTNKIKTTTNDYSGKGKRESKKGLGAEEGTYRADLDKIFFFLPT